MMGKEIKIDLYSKDPLGCRPYDPLSVDAAEEMINLIKADHPELKIEHVGSSAVPGCDGKGILDILVAPLDQYFEEIRDYIDGLGFQKQISKDPFPETRPMRVGAFNYKNGRYNVHIHIVKYGTPEVDALIKFRDKLRSDENLIQMYIAEKKKIISSGISDSVDYSYAKTDFIKSVLNS